MHKYRKRKRKKWKNLPVEKLEICTFFVIGSDISLLVRPYILKSSLIVLSAYSFMALASARKKNKEKLEES